MGALHLVKLCVGVDRPEELEAWHVKRRAAGQPLRHTTRMWPRREAELLAGGSLYWVMKGAIRARQPIERLEEEVGVDGVRRCRIILGPSLIRTETAPRRAFQGWRYLTAEDAPRDLDAARGADEASLPEELENELAALGVVV